MPHPFDGHRVYNGCPDSTMQRRLDAEAAERKALLDELRKTYPNVCYTYFPVEQAFMASSGSPKWEQLSDFQPTSIAALKKALCSTK